MRENTLDSDVKTQQQPKTNKNNKKKQLSKHNKAKSSHSPGPSLVLSRLLTLQFSHITADRIQRRNSNPVDTQTNYRHGI